MTPPNSSQPTSPIRNPSHSPSFGFSPTPSPRAHHSSRVRRGIQPSRSCSSSPAWPRFPSPSFTPNIPQPINHNIINQNSITSSSTGNQGPQGRPTQPRVTLLLTGHGSSHNGALDALPPTSRKNATKKTTKRRKNW